MGPLDLFWHLANFFVPALGVGLLGATATKLLWRRELRGVPLRRLAVWGCGVAAAVLVAGLLLGGRDGRMATYVAMVLGTALALAWAAFGRR